MVHFWLNIAITAMIIAIAANIFAAYELSKALRAMDELSASRASARAKASESSVALTEASKASIASR